MYSPNAIQDVHELLVQLNVLDVHELLLQVRIDVLELSSMNHPHIIMVLTL